MRITYTRDHFQRAFIIQIVLDDENIMGLPVALEMRPRSFVKLSQQLLYLADVVRELESASDLAEDEMLDLNGDPVEDNELGYDPEDNPEPEEELEELEEEEEELDEELEEELEEEEEEIEDGDSEDEDEDEDDEFANQHDYGKEEDD